MNGYWYVGPAPDGRRFCWAKEPTFRCLVHERAYAARQPDATPTPALLAAADGLGVDVRWLAMRVAGASHGRARGDDGKLTDRCACGARMERLGFGYWTERLSDSDDVGATITRRLGGEPTERLDVTHYADTKREAQAWAREQLQVARDAGDA